MNDSIQPDPLKRMKLYQHVERVERALEARGLAPPAALDPSALADLDQLHYEGLEAVDHAAGVLGLEQNSRVLDAGSGLGGPARWLAHRHGCEVTAVELQQDLHECAERLTQRCGLGERLRHLQGDLLDPDVVSGPFDAVVSWLVFLHIPRRDALLNRCRQHLETGGGLYAEDFFALEPFTDDEQRLLLEDVQCPGLVDRTTYIDELHQAGFGEIRFEDRTAEWSAFVHQRLRAFRSSRAEFVDVHGVAAFEALESFYRVIDRLFSGGRLGGVRLSARAV